MKKNNNAVPDFFIDSLPDIANTKCRDLDRRIKIRAGARDIYVWLTQLRIAPYSYDLIDNSGQKSPGYIIENLPPVKLNDHYLLAFHIIGFEENKFIAGRFCVPVNPPINRYFKEMYIEYRIREQGGITILWCRVKGWYHNKMASVGFFYIFSQVNLIMTRRQLKKIRKLSEKLVAGQIKRRKYELNKFYSESGLLWWALCRRHNCKGLIT